MTKKNEFWFDDIFGEMRELDNISYTLQSLAKAFRRTGNVDVSDEMDAIAESLFIARDRIQKAVGEHCTEEYKQSEQATKNMVSAALSGILMEANRATKVITNISKVKA